MILIVQTVEWKRRYLYAVSV